MDSIKRTNDHDNLLQLVSFKLDDEEFGIDILKVREINKLMQITKMPSAPGYVEGIINLRGKIIPIINLRLKLGLTKTDYNNSTRIVVVDVEKSTIGFIVDAVNEVLRIPTNVTEEPPKLVNGMNSEFINAVAKLDDRLLILIDLDKTFKENEKMSIKEKF